MEIEEINKLCIYFRLKPEDLTYIEKLEINYISKHMDKEEILHTIRTFDYKYRGARKRLYEIFFWCQNRQIMESGRYDVDTLKPPMGYN